MNDHAFTALKASQTSWWYAARQALVTYLIERYIPHPRRSLDVGAGFGGMFDVFPIPHAVDALEPNTAAANQCKLRGYEAVFHSDTELNAAYDLFGLFDVLEHAEDDKRLLASLIAHSSDQAIFILNVPAFPQLWSEHDREHHHFRRYTRTTLKTSLERAGLQVLWLNYWNSLLFPVAYILRRLDRTGQSSFSLPRWQDQLLHLLLKIEGYFVKKIPMPWGTSLLAVAKYTEPMPKSHLPTARHTK